MDFTAFDAQVTGANGAAGSASGNIDGGDGGNAVDSLAPYSNTDFSLEPSLERVFPTTIGGDGGSGAGGANSTATTQAVQGGLGGKAGAAFITLANDTFGSASNHYSGFVTITATANVASGGSAAGGAGGRGGLGITVTTGGNGSNDSTGTDGAGGGAGGIAETANTDLTGMTSYATSDLTIQLVATGGQGGQGGFGGAGGNGSLSAGNGGAGAAGGSGGPTEATFSGATAFNDSAIFVIEKVTGGSGGGGGYGGNGGNVGPVGSPPTGYGSNGNGADGGRGGGASATVSDDTLTGPSAQFTLDAYGGLGGAGGLGGNAGPALGQNGVAGADGAGSIVFTNNVVTVGSGIPGDTLNSGSNLLLLNLRVGDIGPAGFFPGALDGGIGGNLAFSGNTFIGNGASRLVLQLGSTGTATVDTALNTMSIDGSSTNNTLSGFNNFTLDTDDTFVAGGGAYQVTFAADADTLVFTPNSGNVTLSGITSTNFLLDFRGFGPSFDAAALASDTDASTGSTVITLSPNSAITLQGYTGGIASGNVLFEAACYVEGTRIATPDGEVMIEGLKIGDTVSTASGGARPVRWLGHRRVEPRRHPRPAAVWPIRVCEGAFGDGLPRRDLWLSPDHAIAADGVLIPVKALVNGRTLTQEPRDAVTYWHVELDEHDLVLAEGLACESYLDTGNRAAFENSGATIQLFASFTHDAESAWGHAACAPLVERGPILAAVRRRLAARARALGRPVPRELCIPLTTAGPTGADVPGDVEAIRIVSSSGLQSGDRRRLGALITELRIDGALVPLNDQRLGFGFQEVEFHGEQAVRWTDGDATIAIGPSDHERRVDIHVAFLPFRPPVHREA